MVLTALTPVWVALLSPLALQEQPSRWDATMAQAKFNFVLPSSLLRMSTPRPNDDPRAQVIADRNMC